MKANTVIPEQPGTAQWEDIPERPKRCPWTVPPQPAPTVVQMTFAIAKSATSGSVKTVIDDGILTCCRERNSAVRDSPKSVP